MPEPRVILKSGREKPFLQGHPWVFSGAVQAIEGAPAPGDVASLLTARGQFLGRGFVNPASQIVMRIAVREDIPLDFEFLGRRLDEALELRRRHLPGAEALRLVNAEGDLLPGLVVDQYGPWLVVQSLSAGIENLLPPLIDLLQSRLRPRGIYERSDSPARAEEGLPSRRRLLAGDPPPAGIEFTENGVRFEADPLEGQKTGFYLDQRVNRALCRFLASGAEVLDAFSYVGGFAVSAAAGGAASLDVVEDNPAHLHSVTGNLRRNGLESVPCRLHAGDAFRILRDLERTWDLVVLDPPPFARSRGNVGAAARGYKDINLQGFRRLRRGGHLLTFSCSYHVDLVLFQQIVFAAAADSGRTVQVLARLGPPPDHPVSLHHPQGEYLKGLLCRVL